MQFFKDVLLAVTLTATVLMGLKLMAKSYEPCNPNLDDQCPIVGVF